MKRFFSFLLFLCLLCVAVTALWIWKNPRYGAHGFDLRRSLLSMFGQENGPRHQPEKYTVADTPYINAGDVNILAAMSRQRVLLAKAVVPSVVSITTTRAARSNAPNDDPLFKFFHRGMRQPNNVPDGAQGSGAIVSKEGHIVTNNHVIEGMDQIEVELSDGRRKQATLIGTDKDSDIAVLKIDADELTPIPFGDSDAVEVGETVMAVGNPYGLEESVTQGIISAKGRIASENTNSLFQIDAAINPGNSGGPLVNVRGELIGINEQIYTESGGWQGVGFAIPAGTVRRAMDSILATGRVIHHYLGVEQAQLTRQNAKQHGLGDRKGVLVDRVVAGSPAEKADIRAGDLIEKFNDRPVANITELRNGVEGVELNTAATVELLRDGKTVLVKAQIAERPPAGSGFSAASPSSACRWHRRRARRAADHDRACQARTAGRHARGDGLLGRSGQRRRRQAADGRHHRQDQPPGGHLAGRVRRAFPGVARRRTGAPVGHAQPDPNVHRRQSELTTALFHENAALRRLPWRSARS